MIEADPTATQESRLDEVFGTVVRAFGLRIPASWWAPAFTT